MATSVCYIRATLEFGLHETLLVRSPNHARSPPEPAGLRPTLRLVPQGDHGGPNASRTTSPFLQKHGSRAADFSHLGYQRLRTPSVGRLLGNLGGIGNLCSPDYSRRSIRS